MVSTVPLRPTSLIFDRTPPKSVTRRSGLKFLTQALIVLASCESSLEHTNDPCTLPLSTYSPGKIAHSYQILPNII